MFADRSDRAWVDALKPSADAAARDAVLADLRDYLRRTLAKGFGQKLQGADLDDLAQESVLRVHMKIDSFEGQARFTTWAATIAVNAALSELRRRKHQHVSIDDAIEHADWSADESAHVDEHDVALLRRGIAEALTERQREAVQAALGGIPLMELARRYGVSQGAIYKLLHDARRRLKRFMEEAREQSVHEGARS